MEKIKSFLFIITISIFLVACEDSNYQDFLVQAIEVVQSETTPRFIIDEFSYDQLQVELFYLNGDTKIVSADASMVSISDQALLKTYGRHEIIITYRGISTKTTVIIMEHDGPFTVTFEQEGQILDVQSVLPGEAAEQPSLLINKGYELSGWTSSFNEVYQDLVVEPVITEKVYSIDYELNGGIQNELNPNTYTITTQDIVLNAPSKEHHEFIGWININNEFVDGIVSGSIGSMYLRAVYEKTTYTLSFNINIAMTIDDQFHQFNALISLPNISDVTGYTYIGVFEDDTYTQPFSMEKMPGEDVVVYVYFEINTYTVNFNDEDGALLSTQTVNYLEDAVAPSEPFKTGYTFTGWDNSFTDVKEDITVTAMYSINTYTVIFNDEDGALLSTQTVNYLEDAVAPTEPSKIGYTFTGWDASFIDVTEDITVTATYSINTYTVTFKDAEGTLLSTQTVNYLEDAIAPTEPSKTGYTFTGWDTSFTEVTENIEVTATYTINTYTLSIETNTSETIDGLSLEYQASITYPNISLEGYSFGGWYLEDTFDTRAVFTHMPAHSFTIYAKWTINPYTISLHNIDDNVVEIVEEYNSVITLPNVSKEGYTFMGWYEDTSLTQAFTLTSMPAYHINLYASWLINTYTVSFKDADGTLLSSQSIEYLNDAIAPTEPSKTGYTFAGWDASLTEVTKDITVTATYTINTYTVTFKDADGTLLSTQTINYLNDAVAPTEPSKTGYTFNGWDASFTEVTKDILVTATYSIETYTVTFKDIEGTVISTQTIDYFNDAIAPTEPSKTGYTFTGWDASFTEVTKDIIVTATYSINTYTVTFKDTDGTAISTQSVEYLNDATEPGIIIPTGYVFKAWSESFNDITSDITTQLIIEQITYTFTVISPLLDDPYEDTLTYQETMTYPSTERIGYVFDGYYEDQLYTISFYETTMPDRDVTLYPKWLHIETKTYIDELTSLVQAYENIMLPYYYQNDNFMSYYQPLTNTIGDVSDNLTLYKQIYQLGNALLPTQVTTIETYIVDIETKIFQINVIQEVYESLKYRPASEGLGLEWTVNQASINGSGSNRMRIHTSLEDSTVYFMLSQTLMQQRLVSGIFGLGLKTGMFNFLKTEHLYAFSSGSDTIYLYDNNEEFKSEETLQAEIETLSFNWVSSPYFARFNALAYRTISTTFVMMLEDHENIHERTTFSIQIDFEFVVSSLTLFDTEMYYGFNGQSIQTYDVNTYQTYMSQRLTAFEATLPEMYDDIHQTILEQGLIGLADTSTNAFDYYIHAYHIFKNAANQMLNVNDM